MPKQKEEPRRSFEEMMDEAEALAAKMERGGVSLDQSLEAYARGMKLLENCADLLKEAEEKIKILQNDENGNPRLAPFDPEARK